MFITVTGIDCVKKKKQRNVSSKVPGKYYTYKSFCEITGNTVKKYLNTFILHRAVSDS